MGFFVSQIFLPALAFAYSSSTVHYSKKPIIVDVDEDEYVDGRGPYLGILSFTFVVLLCCLYRTYQNDDEQIENYINATCNPISLV